MAQRANTTTLPRTCAHGLRQTCPPADNSRVYAHVHPTPRHARGSVHPKSHIHRTALWKARGDWDVAPAPGPRSCRKPGHPPVSSERKGKPERHGPKAVICARVRRRGPCTHMGVLTLEGWHDQATTPSLSPGARGPEALVRVSPWLVEPPVLGSMRSSPCPVWAPLCGPWPLGSFPDPSTAQPKTAGPQVAPAWCTTSSCHAPVGEVAPRQPPGREAGVTKRRGLLGPPAGGRQLELCNLEG